MFQISLVYFYTAVAKTNPVFLSGEVLESVIRIRATLKPPYLMQPLAVGVIALEFFLVFGLWSRALQRWAFLFGLFLHVAISTIVVYTGEIRVFGAITVASYVVFLGFHARSRVVLWNSESDAARRIVGRLRRLDWLGVHRFVAVEDGAVGKDARIVSEEPIALEVRDGPRVYRGFRALVEILCATPLSFFWAAVLMLPPLRQAGERTYRQFAAP